MTPLVLTVPLLGILFFNLPLGRMVSRWLHWFGIACCAVLAILVLHGRAWLFAPASSTLLNSLPFRPFFNDSLTYIMLLAIGIVGFTAFMVRGNSKADENQGFLFDNLLVLALVGMAGVVLASDLFTMYVFIEIVAVASYILIAFDRDAAGLEGSFKYLVMSAVATLLMLTALALLSLAGGSLHFGALIDLVRSGQQSPLVVLALGLFMCGVFVKAGLMPFHGWLPDAYASAPPAASVLLAGIVTKTSGIYTLIRVFDYIYQNNYTTGLGKALLLFGAISIVVGALAALTQKDFKRMLAYSSISQMGYIVLGVGVGTPLGLAGAMLHLFNHSIFKTLLFVNAAAIESQTGGCDMDELGGLANRMPVTGTTSVLALLSVAGIPPLSGFWSKLLIAVALYKVGSFVYLAIMLLASALTLGYFLHMQQRVFFGKVRAGLETVREAGPWILIPSIVLALITLGLGIGMPWLFETFLVPIRSILL